MIAAVVIWYARDVLLKVTHSLPLRYPLETAKSYSKLNQHNLSILGRSSVANSLVMSPICHPVHVVSLLISFFAQVHSSIIKFISRKYFPAVSFSPANVHARKVSLLLSTLIISMLHCNLAGFNFCYFLRITNRSITLLSLTFFDTAWVIFPIQFLIYFLFCFLITDWLSSSHWAASKLSLLR